MGEDGLFSAGWVCLVVGSVLAYGGVLTNSTPLSLVAILFLFGWIVFTCIGSFISAVAVPPDERKFWDD